MSVEGSPNIRWNFWFSFRCRATLDVLITKIEFILYRRVTQAWNLKVRGKNAFPTEFSTGESEFEVFQGFWVRVSLWTLACPKASSLFLLQGSSEHREGNWKLWWIGRSFIYKLPNYCNATKVTGTLWRQQGIFTPCVFCPLVQTGRYCDQRRFRSSFRNRASLRMRLKFGKKFSIFPIQNTRDRLPWWMPGVNIFSWGHKVPVTIVAAQYPGGARRFPEEFHRFEAFSKK